MRDWVEVTTIGDALVRAASLHPDDLAVVLPPDRVTYRQLHHDAQRIALGLLGLGIRPGDRVGILMPNCLPWIHTFFAATLIGAVTVPINTRYAPAELAHVIGHAGLSALVTTVTTGTAATTGTATTTTGTTTGTATTAAEGLDLAATVRAALQLVEDAEPTLVLLGGGGAEGFIDDTALAAAAASVAPGRVEAYRRRVRIRDLAVLLYTSGTTSRPKGCMHSHEPLVRTGTARLLERPAARERAAVWIPCPLFHVGALVPLIGCVATRAPFVTSRRFDAAQAIDLLRDERVGTALPLFAAFTEAIMNHPRFDGARFPDLRYILTTGSRAAVARAQRAFAPARLISAYGMTETCGVSAISAPEESDDERLDWDGTPLRGIEIAVLDPDTGEEAEPGRLGELVARGYCVFDAYYRDPEATAAAFDADGWFHTGDMGISDGSADRPSRIGFRGRYKDMLKVGGENVAATEVEDLVSLHPAVAQVAVIGVADPRLDEVPAAYVELVGGAELSPRELIEFCRGRAAPFKVPRFVGFIPPGEWPMSATKVNKVALRARAPEDFKEGT